MKDIKIIVTAPPRSGHAWFTYLLKKILSPYFTKDSFIERNNLELMLSGVFKDTLQTTILRKPEEIVPSNITKIFAGLGQNYTQGITMPHELENNFTIETMTSGQLHQYIKWLDQINKNIDNLIPFTFEQVAFDSKIVCNYFIKHYNINNIDVNNINIEQLKKLAEVEIHQHHKTAKEDNNALPVNKKPKIYYEAKSIIFNDKIYSRALELYKLTEQNIKNRQLDLEI
jgi:hypothetical protein